MKAADHRKLTGRVVELFHHFSKSSFSEKVLEHKSLIEEGADREDVSPILTRIMNWHFYKQNRLLVPQIVWYGFIIPLPVTPTSDKIVQARINLLHTAFQKKDFDKAAGILGRILHHIQDMSTPAHVVPVYHGPELADSFEDYSAENIDAFLQTLEVTTAEFEKIVQDRRRDIYTIYTSAAEKTLHHLYVEKGAGVELHHPKETVKGGWNLFWAAHDEFSGGCSKKPYKKIKGFGCYGPLGMQFGRSRIEFEGKDYIVDPSMYSGLYTWLLKKQTFESLQLLSCAELLQRESG